MGWKYAKKDFPDDSCKWAESGRKMRSNLLDDLRCAGVKVAEEYQES